MQTDHIDDHLHALWDASGPGVEETEIAGALDVFREKRREYEESLRKRRLLIRAMKYAAVIIAPLLTALAVWNYSGRFYAENGKMVELYVPEGGMDSLLLSDNTKVMVNAGTSIVYPSHFSRYSTNRDVYVNGNCHFAVAKDADHPFVVNMGSLKVKVLGTHFSVSNYNEAEKIVVTLEEGMVKAYDSNRAMTLKPNEQLVYDRKTHRMAKHNVDALAYNSWVNGTLDFDMQTLADIVRALERRYDITIDVAHDIDLSKRYMMSFNKDEKVESVMKVVAMVAGNLSYKIDGRNVRLYKAVAPER